MKPAERSAQARRELDRRFQSSDLMALGARPRSGWIRSIRQALGMSQAVLGRRVGVTGAAIAKLERAEVSGGITLSKLAEVAAALDCTVSYAFVPTGTLQGTVERQARRVALQRLRYVSDTMALEGQAIASGRSTDDLDRYTRALIERNDVWTDEPADPLSKGAAPG